MGTTDPFFVVKSEVEKTIELVNRLYSSWKDLNSKGGGSDELHRLSDELRNNLRSIEWDLEDLEDTIRIAEKNPRKFKLEPGELLERNAFVKKTRNFTQMIREQVERPRKMVNNHDTRLHMPSKGQTKRSGRHEYMKLQDDGDFQGNNGDGYMGDDDNDVQRALQQQQVVMEKQDEQLTGIGNSVRGLKHVSALIASELDEQAVMIDDLGEGMEHTETKMDGVMKKMAKVLHMTNDRKQWVAICILLAILFVLILLFILL